MVPCFPIAGLRCGTVWEEGTLTHLAKDSRPVAQLRELSATVPVKTHALSDADVPVGAVYLIRDGRDSLVSYTHFLLAREGVDPDPGRVQERMADLVEGHPGFGSWSEHVTTWTARSAPTLLVRFEDLVADPVSISRKAAAELGFELPPMNGNPQPPDFDRLRALNPVLHRRGIVGSHRTEMPAEIEARFWELHGECMERFGYPREPLPDQ